MLLEGDKQDTIMQRIRSDSARDEIIANYQSGTEFANSYTTQNGGGDIYVNVYKDKIKLWQGYSEDSNDYLGTSGNKTLAKVCQQQELR